MKFMIKNAVAVAAIAVTAQVLPASAQENFIGEIREFPYNFCPRGWTEASGQLLPISQNQALYSLLGTMYGGDGRTSFALPDYSIEGSAPPPATDVVTVYQHCNYQGWSASLAPGSYSSLNGTFVDNDASSIKIPDGYSVTLFDGPQLDGTSLDVAEDTSCLVASGTNDTLSSLRIDAPAADFTPAPVASGPEVRTCIALTGIYPSRN